MAYCPSYTSALIRALQGRDTSYTQATPRAPEGRPPRALLNLVRRKVDLSDPSLTPEKILQLLYPFIYPTIGPYVTFIRNIVKNPLGILKYVPRMLRGDFSFLPRTLVFMRPKIDWKYRAQALAAKNEIAASTIKSYPPKANKPVRSTADKLQLPKQVSNLKTGLTDFIFFTEGELMDMIRNNLINRPRSMYKSGKVPADSIGSILYKYQAQSEILRTLSLGISFPNKSFFTFSLTPMMDAFPLPDVYHISEGGTSVYRDFIPAKSVKIEFGDLVSLQVPEIDANFVLPSGSFKVGGKITMSILEDESLPMTRYWDFFFNQMRARQKSRQNIWNLIYRLDLVYVRMYPAVLGIDGVETVGDRVRVKTKKITKEYYDRLTYPESMVNVYGNIFLIMPTNYTRFGGKTMEIYDYDSGFFFQTVDVEFAIIGAVGCALEPIFYVPVLHDRRNFAFERGGMLVSTIEDDDLKPSEMKTTEEVLKENQSSPASPSAPEVPPAPAEPLPTSDNIV